MAANLNPIYYALVSKKVAETSEENDSTHSVFEIPKGQIKPVTRLARPRFYLNRTNECVFFAVKSKKPKRTPFVNWFFGRIYGVPIYLQFYLTFTNYRNQGEDVVKHDKKKRNRRNKARKAAVAKALAEAEAEKVMGENTESSEIEKPWQTKEKDSTNPMLEIPINSENQTENVAKYKKRNRRCKAKMAAAAKAVAEAVVEKVLNEHNESLVIDEPQ